jgi:hypothetical protein
VTVPGAAAARRRLVVVGALGVVLALAACSDPAETLDDAATERAVGRSVAAEVAPEVASTRCPPDIARAEGGTFECTVVLAEVGELPVEVTQVDEDGTLEVEPTAAVVATERITEELLASLEKRFGRDFTVRCSGDPVEVRAPASTSTCSARDGSSAREVTVTVVDASGTLAFAVAPAR